MLFDFHQRVDTRHFSKHRTSYAIDQKARPLEMKLKVLIN
jgi:hypothetical protein